MTGKYQRLFPHGSISNIWQCVSTSVAFHFTVKDYLETGPPENIKFNLGLLLYVMIDVVCMNSRVDYA